MFSITKKSDRDWNFGEKNANFKIVITMEWETYKLMFREYTCLFYEIGWWVVNSITSIINQNIKSPYV